MSSAESELYALCSAVMEALFLRNLMIESGLGTSKMIINLYTDSSAAKSLVSRTGPGKKSKHIDLKFLFIQELVLDGRVVVQKVPTVINEADLVTKYLAGDATKKHERALDSWTEQQLLHLPLDLALVLHLHLTLASLPLLEENVSHCPLAAH